jgi:hypothetical protein
MGVIPKTTSPLVKFIRTTEGVFVLFANIALIVVPIISAQVKPGTSLLLGTILNGTVVVARTGLKIVAQLQSAGLTPTLDVVPVPPPMPPNIGQVPSSLPIATEAAPK